MFEILSAVSALSCSVAVTFRFHRTSNLLPFSNVALPDMAERRHRHGCHDLQWTLPHLPDWLLSCFSRPSSRTPEQGHGAFVGDAAVASDQTPHAQTVMTSLIGASQLRDHRSSLPITPQVRRDNAMSQQRHSTPRHRSDLAPSGLAPGGTVPLHLAGTQSPPLSPPGGSPDEPPRAYTHQDRFDPGPNPCLNTVVNPNSNPSSDATDGVTSASSLAPISGPNPSPNANPNPNPYLHLPDNVPPASMFFGRSNLGRRNAAGPLSSLDQEAHELREHKRQVEAAQAARRVEAARRELEAALEAAAAYDDDSSVEYNPDEDAMSADDEAPVDERDVSDNVNLPPRGYTHQDRFNPGPNPYPNPVLNPNPNPYLHLPDDVPPAPMFFGRSNLGRRNAAGPLSRLDQEAHELREHQRQVEAAQAAARQQRSEARLAAYPEALDSEEERENIESAYEETDAEGSYSSGDDDLRLEQNNG